MREVRVKMKDGWTLVGPLLTWQPKEGWFMLGSVAGMPASVRLSDVVSATETGTFLNSTGGIVGVDLLSRAKVEGWDGT